jgi:HlyD family secretion protein
MTAAPPAATDAAVAALLGPAGRRRPLWRRALPWLAALLLLAAAGAGLWWWQAQRTAAAAPQFLTQPVQRGALTVTVTAGGTLQPTRQVNIGSELSGTVARVLVEPNDRVQRGQVLVELDATRLRDQVAGARAALAAAEAAVRQALAAQAEARDTLARLEDVHRRSGGQVPAAAELDAARAAAERSDAQLASARAGVDQARASLSSHQNNLARASIRSPIDGVVLSRAVEPGNAVAASLQAVTLLTLAADLTRMQLLVHVDEADVGRVAVGQGAHFTVAAYPARRFPARIERLGLGPTLRDNVVTYPAELSVDNADLSLRPGMTAVATITTLERSDALLVPNAALRFAPPAPAATPPGAERAGWMALLLPRPPVLSPPRRAGTDITRVRQVWVLGDDGQPRAVAVTPGASDGRMTEVASDALQAGMAVVVGLGGPR